jgi:uronate dehydrogenase
MKILLTGAAGIVGSLIRPLLSDYYEEVLLTDISPITELYPNESFKKGDIQDSNFVDSILSNIDGIVHMAGLVGPEYTFEEVTGPNVIGTQVIFNSARIHGIKKIIYASSHHVVGFMERGSHIDENTSICADSYYGVSKAFGEVLAGYFCNKYGLNILAIRIGSVTNEISDERRTHMWCSPKDLTSLIKKGLNTEDFGYKMIYGVSNCFKAFFDNHNSLEFGYVPEDYSLDFLKEPSICHGLPDSSKPENRFVGGHFAAIGFEKGRS